MKYRVIRDCVGFKGRYWTAGTIVELGEEIPPKHFEPIEPIPVIQKPPEQEITADIEAEKPRRGRKPKG